MDVRQAEIEAWKWYRFFGFGRDKPKGLRITKWHRARAAQLRCNLLNHFRDIARQAGENPDE